MNLWEVPCSDRSGSWKGRRLDSSILLDEEQTVKQAKIQNGSSLTLQLGQVQVRGTTSRYHEALSTILGDGSVATWGTKDYGGDSRTVQDQLKGLQQIQATAQAFAAILSDGSVVTWGDENYGGSGDSRAVQDQLKGVQQIQASQNSFAAILSDGSVVTWGGPRLLWRQSCCARSAEGRAADPSHRSSFCSYPV